MIKILITNRKGGVGKTTTTLNLASGFAKKGLKVLIIDLDTQGHIQYGLGVKHTFEHGIHSILLDQNIDIKLLIQKSKIKNLYFIPANINFNSSLLQDKNALKSVMDRLDNSFDICIIDTAPMSDMILEMAILTSNYVLVPMKTEHLGLIGTVQFIKIFYNMASKLNTNFKFLGVLPTLYNNSIKEHKKTLFELQKIVGKKRVLPPIRRDLKLTLIFKNSIKFLHQEHSRGIKDYENIIKIIYSKILLRDTNSN
jgi:chromosome partitioning protein